MTKAEIERWLTRLSADESAGYCGRLCLINIYHCLKEGIVSRDELQLFLADCVRGSLKIPAIQQFAAVCGKESGDLPLYFALKTVDIRGSDPHELFVTLIEGGLFQYWLLSRSYKSTCKKTLPLRVRNSDDELDYLEVLSSLEGKDWCEAGAHLGKPIPKQINCWFTKHVSVDALIASLRVREEMAEAVRDSLGLVQRKAGDCILSITFPASALQNPLGIQVAQPAFADGVNRRYAAFQVGAGYKDNRSREWGTTVNLGKLAARDADTCGFPERVSSPVPIMPRTFKVEYVGTINSTRGTTAADNDNAFVIKQLGSSTLKSMIDYLVAEVAA